MSLTTGRLEQPSGVKTNARNLLAQRGADVREVISVSTDSILFVDSLSRAKTAWLRHVGAALRVEFESGWPADPSADSLRRLDQPSGGLVVAQQIESD